MVQKSNKNLNVYIYVVYFGVKYLQTTYQILLHSVFFIYLYIGFVNSAFVFFKIILINYFKIDFL